MGKKLMGWKTKGMNRDLSVSAFNPEFAFENMNLRLSTNEGNTLMSWVNEKGTEVLKKYNTDTPPVLVDIILTGVPIGTAVLNHQLIVFTHDTTDPAPTKPDYIYKLEYSSDKTYMIVTELYNGNLEFSTDHPIETLVAYEADNIQKVYWTDGNKQPRVINIAGTIKEEVDTQFDFIPAITFVKKDEEHDVTYTTEASVTKNPAGGGTFAPGVIQYAFTYFNKYGQQSNIVWVSPLYYLTHADRGASPEEKVSNSFTITIKNPDENFDYIRIYSIQRTSLNTDVFAKRLIDLSLTNVEKEYNTATPPVLQYTQISYTDNGTTGATVDPYELLYIGGKEISVLTMADKDKKLFMGNIEEKNDSLQKVRDFINNTRGNIDIEFFTNDEPNSATPRKEATLNHTYGIYSNTYRSASESRRDISTFKGGENYRFGFQLQKYTGEWTEPIWIKDATNTKYPTTSVYSDTIYLPYAKAPTIRVSTFSDSQSEYYIENFTSIYKKVRPVIVYPTINDRKVLCQGVLNPTVFNAQDRKDNSPYAQASWFFRPYMAVNAADTPTADVESDDTEIDSSSAAPIDSNFPPAEYSDVYVLYAAINTQTTRVSDIINKGYLEIIETETETDTNTNTTTITATQLIKHPFIGAVHTGDTGDNSFHIFVSDEAWPEDSTPHVSSDNSSINLSYNYQDVNLVTTTQNTYKLYNGIYRRYGYLYYYVPNQDTPVPATYTFYYLKGINNEQHYSKAVFSKQNYIPEYSPGGNSLSYTHYDSLPEDNAITKSDSSWAIDLTNIPSVEVQGAKNIYDTVFDVNPSSEGSNTQFFIDQSIVTLNSPDVDFDTELQAYNPSDLKLRVIGAIPITANTSAHKISISSSMLEVSLDAKKMILTDTIRKYWDSREKLEPLGDTQELSKTISDLHLEDLTTGDGERNINIVHNNIDPCAGNRLVTDLLWEDVYLTNVDVSDNTTEISTDTNFHKYYIFPWHRAGALNNDWRATNNNVSSLMDTKKTSHLLYSINTEYLKIDRVTPAHQTAKEFEGISSQLLLTENSHVVNYRLPRQRDTSSEINYYPNIDKVLYNKDGYYPLFEDIGAHTTVSTTTIYPYLDSRSKIYTPISMKYKSTSHYAIALNVGNGNIPILPYGIDSGSNYGQYTPDSSTTTFWGDTYMTFSQEGIDMSSLFLNANVHIPHNFLWLGELYRDPSNPFGGSTHEALKANTWVVGGDAVDIPSSGDVTLYWTEGDTYYQRYDCLKTYPFTPEDTNQLVEILSFMCETHVNLDGRYDRNRGQIDNTNMSPRNFNLMNDVYSQKDNFFSYRITDDKETVKTYPNWINYTKTKESGADVDMWTNITLSSMLELDGDKGELRALKRFNDQILAFQDSGISQILYNENVQIASTQGVPIEIANSGKVDGKRYISDTIGCSNKWSMTTTPMGIYFMDSNEKSIYLFNGQLNNLSVSKGFNTWCKQNIPSSTTAWVPSNNFGVSSTDKSAFVTYYDKLNQDVLFINKDTTLAYSEKVGAFTSFYDYGNTPFFCNLDDTGVWVKTGSNSTTLWKHNTGDYCKFFDENKPYWMTLVGNPEPQADKTFTNLEFRATIEGEGNPGASPYVPFTPFDSLESWNEYQHGLANLIPKTGSASMKHHEANATASLNRKFRIWRCDIPRDNVDIITTEPVLPDNPTEEQIDEYNRELAKYNQYIADTKMGTTRFRAHPLDRMRNPWVYLKLAKNAADTGDNPDATLPKAEIHDVVMTYFD